MNEVFLDAVGIIALLNVNDQWYEDAMRSYADHHLADAVTITTSAVMSEVGNAFSRTTLRKKVAEVEGQLSDQDRLLHPSLSEWRSAWQVYANSYPGGPSIVDCTSFEVMRRLGLTRVFTNDSHFRDAGFDVLF